MARVGEETAGISEHTDETAEKSEGRQGVHLLAHTVLLIEKPPGCAILHLSRNSAIVECVGHGREHFGVLRVEVVEYGLSEFIFVGEIAEESVTGSRNRFVVNGVETRVRAEFLEHPAVVVSVGTYVELLGPSAFAVHGRKVEQYGTLELRDFGGIGNLTAENLAKDAVSLFARAVVRIEGVKAVV